MVPQVFISYSRKDAAFVRRLIDDLTDRGVDIWLDQRDIKAGERWDTSVQNALRESDFFMVVLSPESVGSENVLDEIAYAVSKAKHVFPIMYRDCDVPYRLARVQYVDFRGSYETGIEKLLEQMQLAGVPIHTVDGVTPAQTQAGEQGGRPVQAGGVGDALHRQPRTKLPVWVWAAAGALGLVILVLIFTLGNRGTPKVPQTADISPGAIVVAANVSPTSPPASPSATETDVPASPTPTEKATPTETDTPTPTMTPGTPYPIPIAQPVVEDFRFCNRPCTETGAVPVNSYPEKTKYIYLTIDFDGFSPGMEYTRTWSNNGEEWIRYDCIWQGPGNGSKNFRLFDTGGLRSGLWQMEITSEGERIGIADIFVEGSYDYWDPAGYQECVDF